MTVSSNRAAAFRSQTSEKLLSKCIGDARRQVFPLCFVPSEIARSVTHLEKDDVFDVPLASG